MWLRTVTDVALPYELHDLLPREGKFMCAQCSNTTQEPVFHEDVGDCPRSTLPVELTQQRAALATPAPARIQGPQVTKESKGGQPEQPEQPKRKRKAAGDGSDVGEFPCKSALCTKLHYATAGGSNRHMSTLHPEENLEPYPKLPRPRKKRASPVAPPFALELGPLAGTLCARELRALCIAPVCVASVRCRC